jgi:RsiW-degrading membrane proteinase PrsW (M82 family)
MSTHQRQQAFQMVQSVPAAPVQASFQVTIPEGLQPGDQFIAMTPTGMRLNVIVPADVGAGQDVLVHVPTTIVTSRPSFAPTTAGPVHRGYCNPRCLSWTCAFFGVLVVAQIVSVLLMVAWKGFFPIAAISPSVVILEFLRRNYEPYVTRCQMTTTFFESIFWMIVLVGVLIGLSKIPVYPFRSSGYETGDCPMCIGFYAFTSYFMAGTLEEITKFLAIRRIMFSPIVHNPRAIWVYGACAGAGFATVENIMYVSQGEVGIAILRAFLSVPLHCCTGLMMGLSLSQSRFGSTSAIAAPTTRLQKFLFSTPMVLFPCIFVHGTYDFALFVSAGVGGQTQWLVLLSIALLVTTVAVIRQRMIVLERAFPESPGDNIHALIASGHVARPCTCCSCMECCY